MLACVGGAGSGDCDCGDLARRAIRGTKENKGEKNKGDGGTVGNSRQPLALSGIVLAFVGIASAVVPIVVLVFVFIFVFVLVLVLVLVFILIGRRPGVSSTWRRRGGVTGSGSAVAPGAAAGR